MDKKRVIGLLVKGNKAKNLVSKGVKIPSKVYCLTRGASVVSHTNLISEQSIDYSGEVSPNVNSIVTPLDESDENKSECNIIQHTVTDGCSLDSSRGGIVHTDTKTYYPENDREMHVQVNDSYNFDDQMVKVFDINCINDNKFLNTLLSKQVIKKIKGNEYAQCEAFKKWRQQTDFD